MPESDPRKGSICIWLTSCIFFVAIITGGVFLCMYIVLPETKSTDWFAIVGIVLVGIPWFFWFVTFLYRCVSWANVKSGSRNGGTAGGGGGGGANAGPPANDVCGATSADSPMESPGIRARRVQFGSAIVVGQQDRPLSIDREENETDHATSTSSNVSSDDSDDQSEIPLTLSMPS